MRRQRSAAAVLALALLTITAACDDDRPRAAASPDQGEVGASAQATAERAEHAAAGGWAPTSDAPLDPRHGASAFWIDGTFLVLGGRDTPACPPGADCVRPDAPPLRDGARYDPTTDTWTRIARAPRPLGYASGATVGDVLYLLLPGFDLGPRGRPSFLAYDAAADSWAQLPLPPGGEEVVASRLVAAGERVIAVLGTQERRVLPDLVYDPATRTWEQLPLDPLAPSFDRSAVWTGDELVLLAIRNVASPGSAGPSLYRAAALDLESRRWRRLPDSQVVGSNPMWFWAGDRVVNASTGSADGGEVNGWGRAYPFGGVLDPATGTWTELPPVPAPDADAYTGPQAGGGEHVVGPDGWVLHVPTMEWIRLPRPAGTADEGAAVAWGGGALFVWGGIDWGERDQRSLADGWVWRP